MNLRLTFVVAAAAFASLAATALAQDGVYDDGEIVVHPYGIERENTGRGPLGAREETLYLSSVVTAEGLDLRYNADVRELYRRVDYTAHVICDRLDRATRGASSTSDRECVRDAVRGARPQVEDVVYRARY